jgi:hypothetical protein
MYSVAINSRYSSTCLRDITILYANYSLRSKKTIKVTLSSITRIGLIVYIEDPKEAPGVDHIYIKEDTKVEETTIVDIATTTYPIRSNAISVINLDTS